MGIKIDSFWIFLAFYILVLYGLVLTESSQSSLLRGGRATTRALASLRWYLGMTPVVPNVA